MAASPFWFSAFSFFLARVEGRLPSFLRAGGERVIVVCGGSERPVEHPSAIVNYVMRNEMTQGQRQRGKSRGLCSRETHIGGRQGDARRENRKKPEKQENQKS